MLINMRKVTIKSWKNISKLRHFGNHCNLSCATAKHRNYNKIKELNEIYTEKYITR